MARFEYKFVRVGKMGVFDRLKKRDLQEYQEIIAREGKSGWRFVQAFAPAIYGYGAAKFIDLIFERDDGGATYRGA